MTRTATLILFIGFIVTVGLWRTGASSAQDDATPPAVASPSPDATSGFVFPEVGQVPDGLVVISDGERTLDDVASGFSDPVATIELFVAWGWRGNDIRAFHVADDISAEPTAIDGVYISVHEFGSPQFAAEALDYSLEEHLNDPALDEVARPGFGDHARTLFGEMAYGNEITFYVQRGSLVIRLSASSPEGDPTVEATQLMEALLNAQPATPVAT